jgi:hypothetical protein
MRANSYRPLCFAAIAVLFGGNLTPAARADVISTFDTNNQGFRRAAGGGAGWNSPGGNPGGYAFAGYLDARIMASSAYGGNQGAATALTFDLRLNVPYDGLIRNQAVVIGTPTLALASTPLMPPPNQTWQSYTLSLTDPLSWRVITAQGTINPPSFAQLQAVLSNLNIAWSTDYNEGSEINLDNVNLVGGTPGGYLGAHPWNVDLVNRGPEARALQVVFGDQPNVEKIYQGHPDNDPNLEHGQFQSVNRTLTNGRTYIDWTNFNDDDNDRIDPGQSVHVGAVVGSGPWVEDFYYIDAAGRTGAVYDVGSDILYDPATASTRVTFLNAMQPPGGASLPIDVTDVRYLITSTQIPLEDLNDSNVALNSQLQPLPGGNALSVNFGQRILLDVPGPIPNGSSIVVRYRATAPGSSADVLHFLELTIPEPTTTALAILSLAAASCGRPNRYGRRESTASVASLKL